MLFFGSDECSEVSRTSGTDSNGVSVLGFGVTFGHGVPTTAKFGVEWHGGMFL